MASQEGGDPYSVELGGRLRAVRKQRRLSLQDVEAASHQEFKASVLGAYERGQRRIAAPRLQRLAQLYRVPVDQLLPEAGKTGQDYLSPGREGGQAGGGRAVIDLTRLEDVTGSERDLLQRYVTSIEVQRQDFNGQVITIRGDDLRVIASMFDLSPAGMLERLDGLGVLFHRSGAPA
ncbi:MAG: transcriptional regulator [Acidimicrobiales bacterium]